MLADKDLLSIQEVRTKVEKAYAAWQKYRTYSQEQVDAIVERMAAAARAHAKRLAELAVEETGYGNAKDKYIKNLLTSDWLPRRMRGMKTVGILRELPEEKMVEIGVPMGVVAAILPTTNPTSTAIYKTLISLKAGNAIVISPHPRAHRCTCDTAAVLYQAAVEAGAPEDIIQCVDNATLEGTNALMRHERTGVDSFHRRRGHREGRLFQRQAGLRRRPRQRSRAGGYLGRPGRCHPQDRRRQVVRLRHGLLQRAGHRGRSLAARPHPEPAQSPEGLPRHRRPEGRARQAAHHAELDGEPQLRGAGAHQDRPHGGLRSARRTPPSSAPKWAAWASSIRSPPRSSRRCCRSTSCRISQPACETCFALLKFGGMGHTAVIYSKNDARTREYAMRMPAYRILVNTPSPQGSTGITTNVFPSMTLGCGAAAGNSTSDNVGPLHLINIKRLAYVVRKPEEAFEMPLDYNAATYPPAAARRPAMSPSIARWWPPPWSATWLPAA